MTLISGKLLTRRTAEASIQGVFRSKRNRPLPIVILAGCVSVLLALAGAGCSTMHDMHSSEQELHPPNAEHDAEHNEHSDRAALSLNDGNKWPTDEPLRKSMQAIDELMMPVRAVAPDQLVDSKQGNAIALEVRQQVDFMIANCELEPKADAALHVLIGDLLVGANELQVPGTSRSGVSRIDQVLEQYPRNFEHPGWLTSAEGGS